jgi:hypothetical protein
VTLSGESPPTVLLLPLLTLLTLLSLLSLLTLLTLLTLLALLTLLNLLNLGAPSETQNSVLRMVRYVVQDQGYKPSLACNMLVTCL